MAGAPKAPTAPPPAKPKVSEWTAIAPAAVASGEGIRWLRLLPTAALVAIGIAALQMATSSNRTASAATEPTEASASETAAAKAASSATAAGLGLNITSREHQLEIRWNRESAAVMTSDGGTMKITDDGITEAVPFDQGQLRDGYVAYTPKTNDVSIRLEVTGKDGGTASESTRWVSIP